MRRRLYTYIIDTVNTRGISGWCFSRVLKPLPMYLQFCCDGVVVGSAWANLPRQDVRDWGFHPTGRCGFSFTFPSSIDWASVREVSIRGVFPPVVLIRFSADQLSHVMPEPFPRIFFMHIPKTAGTSFNSFATSYFPDSEVATYIEGRPEDTYPEVFRDHAYVAGHVPMRKYRKIVLDAERDLYSIVRLPLRHIHSQFNWLRWIGEHEGQGFFELQPKIFRGIALRLRSVPPNDASALREFIAGLKGFPLHLFDNAQTRFFLDEKVDKVTMADLAIARKNMALFRDIGLTEDYPAFQRRFCEAYGLKPARQLDKLNQSFLPPCFDIKDPDVQDALRPLVEVDLELYEQIKTTFN